MPETHHPIVLIAWTAAFSVLLAPSVHGELLAVAAIARHGARNVLPKAYNLTESDVSGGPSLLAAGKQQCESAGVAFRARYIAWPSCASTAGGGCLAQPSSSTAAGGNASASPAAAYGHYGLLGSPGVEFSNYNTLVRSSALDRTLLSVQAFLAGVFPGTGSGNVSGQQMVPVYSVDEPQDRLIRGYTRCPAYTRRLHTWLSSQEFRGREIESAPLRDRVAAAAPALNTSLSVWWNVYDAFSVWRTYGVGDPMPELDDATMEQVQELAYWLELRKASSELSGNLLGGALLGDLLSRLSTAVTATEQGSRAYHKLLLVSGHYNTQLGLLAALRLDAYPPAAAALSWLRQGGSSGGGSSSGSIPANAAVLALELHAGATMGRDVRALRLVAQDGPQAAYVTVPLPCAQAGDAAERLVGQGACMWEAFVELAIPAALDGVGAWCSACENTEMDACVAATAQLQAQGAGGSGNGSGCGLEWKLPVAVVCSVLGTACLIVFGAWVWRQRQGRARGAAHGPDGALHGAVVTGEGYI